MSNLNTIQDLLADDRIEDALELFKVFIDENRPDLEADWVNFRNRFSNLEREIRRDLISYEKAGRVRLRIVDGINALIEIAERPGPDLQEITKELSLTDKIILEGLEKALQTLAEKMAMLQEAHSSASDGSKKFKLQKDLEKTEKEIADIKVKIQDLIG
ncbi:MAG: hypothetical protein AAF598_15125 [Bacteroidota bacterium]